MSNNKDRKKQLKEAYKARKIIGGVYRVLNRETGRYYLQSTDDLQGTQNWFGFCQSQDSCSLPPVTPEWKEYGKTAFALEILEELEKKETQTREEFQADLKVLLDYWREQLDPDLSY